MATDGIQRTQHWNNSDFLLTKRSFPLPPELLIKIFMYLCDSQLTLHSISLVCKQWLHCVSPILYANPQISDTYRWATFILTLTREKMSFFYGDLIRSLDLSSGKSIEAMKDQEFYKRLSDVSDQRRHLVITRQRQNDTVLDQQEQEYLVKGLPLITVSTSSLIQLAHTCKNLTSINLSYTSLLQDSLIVETGEYLSTLQRYAVQPGLTHIQIPIEEVIQTIGKACPQLKHVKIQRCEWVTAQIIWMFVYYCPNLKRLDARRSTKCTVKRLISSPLELPQYDDTISVSSASSQNGSSIILPTFSTSSSSTTIPQDNEDEEVVVVEEADENAVVHFRFNEETGLYEQVHNHERRVNLRRQLIVEEFGQDTNTDHRTFWLFNNELETDVAQSMLVNGQPKYSSTEFRSLKEIVYKILLDAKNLGALDLNWLQEY